MRVSVCVTVDVPTTMFSAIEEACVAAGRKAAREALPRATGRWFEWLHLWLVATLPSRLTWALWRGLAKVRSGLRSGFA